MLPSFSKRTKRGTRAVKMSTSKTDIVNLEVYCIDYKFTIYPYIYKADDNYFMCYQKADRHISKEQYEKILALPTVSKNESHNIKWMSFNVKSHDDFMEEYWWEKQYYAVFQIGNDNQVLGIGKSMTSAREDAKQWFDNDIGILQLTSTDDLKGLVYGDSAIAPCSKELYEKVKQNGKICKIEAKNGKICER